MTQPSVAAPSHKGMRYRHELRGNDRALGARGAAAGAIG